MFLVTMSLARGLLPSLFTAGSVISIYSSFCIPLVLGIRELFSIWSMLPGPVTLSAFSNLPLSISCLMFSLAICPGFALFPCFCSFSSLLQTSQGCAFWETRCVPYIKAGNYRELLSLFSAVFAQESM